MIPTEPEKVVLKVINKPEVSSDVKRQKPIFRCRPIDGLDRDDL